jgi:hypothetical protein
MEEFPFLQSPLDLTGLTDEKVHGERRPNRQADLERLIELVAGRHDDEDVDVAIGVWDPVGIRPEEDNFVRPKALRDLPGEPADDTQGNIRAGIPTSRFGLRDGKTFREHEIIVSPRN